MLSLARNARAEVDALVTGCVDGPTSDKGYGLKNGWLGLADIHVVLLKRGCGGQRTTTGNSERGSEKWSGGYARLGELEGICVV